MKNELKKIIENTLKDLQPDIKIKEDQDTLLYPENLDSVGLVGLLMGVEEAIEDELDKDVTLADAKAMSSKNSPFASVNLLVDYAMDKMNDNE